MKVTNWTNKMIWKLAAEAEESKFRRIASNYNIAGYKRIYLIHIRKTGGTSLNNIFLSMGQTDLQSPCQELWNTPNNRLIRNEKIFVGWNVRLINKGNYFYAFSHAPLHKLRLPENTFTITCFRDPVSRVVSHYNMLMTYLINDTLHPCMVTEGKWLGNSFDVFIDRIPQKHLLNQLYMFSQDFNVYQALERIKKVSHTFFIEEFSKGIDELNSKVGFNLKPIHARKASYKTEISEDSILRLKEKLNKEYILLDLLKHYFVNQSLKFVLISTMFGLQLNN